MKFNRVVIKVGSALVAPNAQGCSGKYTLAIAQFITQCQQQGKEVILVSSGSIAGGRSFIHHGSVDVSVASRKAMASVGQMKMMANWQRFFDIPCSQLLITQQDLNDRERFISIKHTINIQLANGILPIVNENDTVASKDATAGDNDNLAALVAQVCEADTLFILADVDGVFTQDPKSNANALLVPVIETVTDEIYAMAGINNNRHSTGGMRSKIEAAAKAVEHGITTYIVNGTRSDVFDALLKALNPGTHFVAHKNIITAKKHWLKHTLKSQGQIVLDEGAVNALLNEGASLLPKGITAVHSQYKVNFQQGDSVDLIDERSNKVVAKGISVYSQGELTRIMGQHSDSIAKILGHNQGGVVVHRDEMVIL